jgi:hypothetical protein
MHFEILTEDASGAALVDAILPGILGPNGAGHSWRLIPFRGIGRLPKNLLAQASPKAQTILHKLPPILRGYGKMRSPELRVMVLVDTDTKDCVQFKHELLAVLESCDPRPRALIRIAVQETEAWLIGDPDAIRAAYPTADRKKLSAFRGDAFDGNWEYLAEVIRPGDSKKLTALGYPELGARKREWAEKIGPNIDAARNRSESFAAFVAGLNKLVEN